MADVIDLDRARAARGVPSTRQVARPSRREQYDLTSKFIDLGPATLGRILRDADRGAIKDFVDLCDRMLSDATVKAAYESRLSAVSASQWIVEPGDPTGDPARDRYAPDAAAFVERVFRDIGATSASGDYCEVGGFEQAVSDLMDGVGKSLAVREIDWQFVANTWVPARLRFVHARRFKYSEAWEPLLVDTGDTVHAAGIPLEPGKFIVHSPRPVAGYPTMTCAMRAVVWPFVIKKWVVQFWLDGAERFAWPFIWAAVRPDTPDEMRERYLSMLKKLSTGHVGVFDAGSEVKLTESTAKDGGTWRELASFLNAEISKGVQGMADAAEASKIGAYGAVKARKGISVDPRIARDERDIAGTIRAHLTYWVLWFNRHHFGGVMPPVPHVRWVISGTKREIKPDAYRAVRVNEVREANDLPPLEGAAGLAMMAGEGLTDAQVTAVASIISSVEAGTRTPETAARLIRLAAPSIAPDEALELAREAAKSAPKQPPEGDADDAAASP
jgi:phage gp29-like protein